MSASPEPAGDAELARLLDFYAQKVYESARLRIAGLPGAYTHPDAARAALLAHVAEHYVRRDSMHLQQRPGGGVALVETKWLDEPPDTDPPIVSGPLSRRAVTIRGRGPARAARYSKGELADGSD